jgi:hypothetical protein
MAHRRSKLGLHELEMKCLFSQVLDVDVSFLSSFLTKVACMASAQPVTPSAVFVYVNLLRFIMDKHVFSVWTNSSATLSTIPYAT